MKIYEMYCNKKILWLTKFFDFDLKYDCRYMAIKGRQQLGQRTHGEWKQTKSPCSEGVIGEAGACFISLPNKRGLFQVVWLIVSWFGSK